MKNKREARCGAELRSLATEDDFERCLSLQRATWGEDFRELVPPTILTISQKVGGAVLGAFERGEMLGFVYGLSGVRNNELAHWSHMLAVREADRGRGIGRDLKEFQRDFLQGLGIHVMYWSYDPLIARNASLNLIALGGRPVEYVRDMYGADTGSSLHSELGTDRFIVRWDFGKGQAEEARVSADSADSLAPPSNAKREDFGLSWKNLIWVEIPSDIDQIKVNDRGAAWEWRERTRSVLSRLVDSETGPSTALCRGLHRTGSGNREQFFYVFSESEPASNGER